MGRGRGWRLPAACVGLCVCVIGCASRPPTATPAAESGSQAVVSRQSERPVEREIVSEAVLLAVGDNLIHDVIYQQARTETGGYDFKPLYAPLQKQIAAADIAFINQETPLVGSLAPSSYPRFNTPVEMAADLRDTGFDLLGIANNHMLDKGADGLAQTLAQIQATEGLAVAGAYALPADRDRTTVLEANGIRFAFVGFTQHTNGLSLPEEKAYMAIYTDDTPALLRQLAQADAQADVVVAAVHWGEENTNLPTDYQREVAQTLAQGGADIILGTHPHVLQPIEYIETEDGRRVLVLYSLGNFVSAQTGADNLIGGLAEILVRKNQTTGRVTIERPQLTPVVTYYGAGMRAVEVYPLSNYSEALAAQHGKRLGLDYIDGVLEEAIGAEYLRR